METQGQAPYVKLPAFQGPLDLLLHLIRQNKVDIYDIPVALVADQYIDTVKTMEALDMEITSEFLVLASQLLFLKSRQLLPHPQKSEEDLLLEEELKQDLVGRLVIYSAYKTAASFLSSRGESSGNTYFHDIDLERLLAEMAPPDPLSGISVEDMAQAFLHVLAKVEKGEDLYYVQADEIPVELMTRDILRRMMLNPKGIGFRQLLRYRTRTEIVVVFIAMLELLKDGKIRAEQSAKENDIFLAPTELARDFMSKESV